MGLPWLGRRIVATLMGRSRPVGDAVGTLVLSGLAAVMVGLTALYEILLLSDANATQLIGGATPFGASITFIAASLAAVSPSGSACAWLCRSSRHGGQRLGSSGSRRARAWRSER